MLFKIVLFLICLACFIQVWFLPKSFLNMQRSGRNRIKKGNIFYGSNSIISPIINNMGTFELWMSRIIITIGLLIAIAFLLCD